MRVGGQQWGYRVGDGEEFVCFAVFIDVDLKLTVALQGS